MDKIKAVISNSIGSITLDGNANGDGQFHMSVFEGFEASDIVINKSDNAVSHGNIVSSIRIDSRQITIEADYDERSGIAKAEMEQALIGLFNPLVTTRIFVNKNGYMRYLDFNVSSFKKGSANTNDPLSFQLIGDASDPFFQDADEFAEDISARTPMLHAPLAFTSSGLVSSVKKFSSNVELMNKGHVETGIDLIIKCTAEVTNPVFTNLDTGAFLKVNKVLSSGDKLEISTDRLDSFIRLNDENISRYKDRGSTYFQLIPGSNTVSFSADDGYTHMEVYPKFRARYLGI